MQPMDMLQAAEQPVADTPSSLVHQHAPELLSEVDDISYAPTQILSPQEMMMYQARRWQQEREREQKAHNAHDVMDVADASTLPLPPDEAASPSALASATEYEQSERTPAAAEGMPAIIEKETTEAVDQETPVGSSDGFPVLAVGATVAGRFEIVQVMSTVQQEHTYQVIDGQSYKYCWNCGSADNTEGDQFCINCGAELGHGCYIMHEYPTTHKQNKEADVLQGTIVDTFAEQGQTYVIEQPQTIASSFPSGVCLLAASASDAGDVRRSEPNEDSSLVLQLQRVHESLSTAVGVFIVADGLGGHDNGQQASRMTINALAQRLMHQLLLHPLATEQASEAAKLMDEDGFVTLLQGAVEDANAALYHTNQRDKTDMGSTITGFMVIEDHAYILNVGDSRTYMLRDGTLYRLTNDHSLVSQMVAGGLIEPDEVYTHPQRSQIFRSLGDKLNVQVDIFKQQILPADILLSCSDGLWEMVRDPQITEILTNAADPHSACMQLVDAANKNGGEDNVSAIVVMIY
jgi:serine/threonine protein phosphatase PrpC